MNLTLISDNNLLKKTKNLVSEEKIITANIIAHLEEIERRKLYCDLKCKSLFDYCVKELKYSEDQAYRRISVMKLSKEVPAVREKINDGELSITNANMLSSLFREIELDPLEKENLVENVSNKSKRECLAQLQKFREEKGQAARPKRPIIKNETSKTVRLNVSISKKTMAKIEQLRGIFGNENKALDEIIDLMADSLIEKKQEEIIPKKKGKAEGKGRYIPKVVKYEAMKKAQNKCQNCGSAHALQYEHIIPVALGGKSIESNIMVLCRSCNQRAGVKIFGVEKMNSRRRENPRA